MSFTYRHGDPRDLHSFPTRRSSDLIGGVRGLAPSEMARAIGPAEGPWADRPMAELVLHINREMLHHGAEIDRKSTRLNSSHSQISYAVFCLKKKKTILSIIYDSTIP